MKNQKFINLNSLLLYCFIFTVVFDPSDKLIGAKKSLFLIFISSCLYTKYSSKNSPPIPSTAKWITFLFGFIFPLLNIIVYCVQGNRLSDYRGYSSLLSHTSLTLLLFIVSRKYVALRLFRQVLMLEVFLTILIYALLIVRPMLQDQVAEFGRVMDFLWINYRSFGDFDYLQVFFKTSPFIVFPLAYYSDKYFDLSNHRNYLAASLLVTCCLALLMSGTRANIIFGILIPAYFLIRRIWSSKSIGSRITITTSSIIFLIFIVNSNIISEMLDPNEFSNAIKIGMIKDYFLLFSDLSILLFGEPGFGVHYFESLDMERQITELTILELFRNFGIIIGMAYIGFWIAPLILMRRASMRPYKWLRIGYASYLCISLTNYFLLSSTGMVMLSFVYAICLGDRNNTKHRMKKK